MNVICVSQLLNHPNNTRQILMPEVGSEYGVADKVEEEGVHYYKLVGLPEDCGYIQSAFAVLPDQTADEMAELEHEAIVNLETVLV